MDKEKKYCCVCLHVKAHEMKKNYVTWACKKIAEKRKDARVGAYHSCDEFEKNKEVDE